MTNISGVPFIHLFKSPKCCYFFDVNKNELVRVNEETYIWLQAMLREKRALTDRADIPAEAASLMESGYLSDYHVEVIRHPMTDDLKVVLERRVTKLTFQLTQACNFRCAYCSFTASDGSQRSHSTKHMTWDMIERGLLFLRDHSIDAPEINIGFYGGEPLLRFDILKQTVEYASKLFFGKTIEYFITTNATLLNEEILAFFSKYEFNMTISIDGTKESHDKNRVFADGSGGTFDAVIGKLLYIRDNYPKYRKKVSLNMVLDPSFDFDLFEDLFRKNPKLRSMIVMSSLIDDDDLLQKNIFSDQYTKKVEYQNFLSYLVALGKTPHNHMSKVLESNPAFLVDNVKKLFFSLEKLPRTSAPSGPCMPGEERLMLTVDGKLIVCERVNEISDCMIMGDIENGFDLEKAQALLNVAKVTADSCKACWAFYACNQCAKLADERGILTADARLKQCDNTRYNFERILRNKAFFEEAQLFYGQGSPV